MKYQLSFMKKPMKFQSDIPHDTKYCALKIEKKISKPSHREQDDH